MRTIAELSSLKGRRALVTGGAGHIGGAIGEALVELGADVAVVDREAAGCRRRAADLSRRGPGRAVGLACDLTQERSARGIVKRAAAELGGLDILIHCAGYGGATKLKGWAAPFSDQTTAAWTEAMRVNLTAAFELSQEAAPLLARGGRGSIILISSIYGIVGPDFSLYEGTAMANPAGYGASKGGLIQLSRYLATTLAPKIRVNCLSPGGVFRGQPKAFVSRYEARTPMKRMAVEEDFKGAVAFLAGDMSAYVTGQNLVVDGGWTAW